MYTFHCFDTCFLGNTNPITLGSLGYSFVADSMWVALQIFEQFCTKAGDANTLVAEPETD